MEFTGIILMGIFTGFYMVSIFNTFDNRDTTCSQYIVAIVSIITFKIWYIPLSDFIYNLF